jgi:cytochrome P450
VSGRIEQHAIPRHETPGLKAEGKTAMTAPLPPGPRGNWLLGSLPEFRRDMLGFYERCARTYGDVSSFGLGPGRRLCLLRHPDHIEHLLTTAAKDFGKRTYVLNLLLPVLGNGLLTSEGDFWLRQRRLMQPAFQRQRIAGYGQSMVDRTLRMLDRWRDGETRDLHADMMRLTVEIAGETLFGADVAADAEEVGEVLDVVMHNFLARWESPLPLPAWIPTPTNLRLRRAIRRLDRVVYRIIRQRRASTRESDDLLSLLLRAHDEGGGSMTDRQLRDEATTLFLAGHETTANALSWTWYLLASHPEAEAKLHAELSAALQGRPPTVADLPRLPYCEHVLLESMRLYPPAYGFGRLALRDVEIGGFRIPRGTTVIVSQWVTQRDPRFFEEPLAFRPERWADDLQKRLPRYAYFPFGGGARVCIGNGFAMMETALVLATVVPRYRFRLVPGHAVTPRPVVTLRPANGVLAVLEKRDAR